MKKRILIAMHYLEIGGAETALIGLLQAFDYSRYDVDLFLYAHRGEMMQFVPKEVNLLPEIRSYSFLEKSILSAYKNGFIGIASARLLGKVLAKIYNMPSFSIDVFTSKLTKFFLPKINPNVKYDLAISFLTPHTYCRDKVRAEKKICWIHSDYAFNKVDVKCELPVWSAFDHVVSISDDVSKTFLQTFPSLKDKIVLIENILLPKLVRERAEEFDASSEYANYYHNGEITISLLSIGRFTYQKNLENIPDICKRISSSHFTLQSSLKVRWFIIGYGGDEQLIRQKIHEAGMEEYVIILGKKSNPYPYIKACDIYVQPSRYEGKSVTVREAQMLYKPVVVTNYPTSKSQIKNGIDGVIVPMDNQGCAEGILQIVHDMDKQQRIIEHLRTHDYGNEQEVEKLYKLLES